MNDSVRTPRAGRIRGTRTWAVSWAVVCWSAAAGFGQLANAADLVTESRVVSGFTSISASVAGEISLTRGAAESLSITALPNTLEQLVTRVDEGVLIISKKNQSSWWRDSGPIRIAITYTGLEALSLSGSADVVTDELSSPNFALEISGSSDVRIPALAVNIVDITVQGSGRLSVLGVETGFVEITVSGSGDVSLEGSAQDQKVVVRGSGNVDNALLESIRVDANISGSGDVSVWATESLRARVSGSGHIDYRGDPELDSGVTGSGDIGPG